MPPEKYNSNEVVLLTVNIYRLLVQATNWLEYIIIENEFNQYIFLNIIKN